MDNNKKSFDATAYDWLGCNANNELSYSIWNEKYRRNEETLDEWFKRCSANNSSIESLMRAKKFLFGGRTLANRGIDGAGSFSNCYSIGYVDDDLDSILKTNAEIAKTFAAHGGQGLSLTKIRPKGAYINNMYTTDGIVPFMKLFNTTTDTISQGGSRKGALMMSLSVWHPEIESFISIKSDKNEITKANLSVEIDDDFMRAVENGVTEVNCVFDYDSGQFRHTVNPVALFEKICDYALRYAEPGILFTNRLRNYNTMEFVEDYDIETTNPCGEQPLPKHGACNLCSINLSEYVLNPFTESAEFDFDSLVNHDMLHIVAAMDDIVSENISRHALPQQRDMAAKYRNIGIGIMGVADMLVKMNMKYGSEESVVFLGEVMRRITRSAIISSSILASKRGTFFGYDSKIFESTFIKNIFTDDEITKLKKYGLRNSTFISIAPTGSIGTMLNVSTGIEPFFRLEYIRTSHSLNNGVQTDHRIFVKALDEYHAITGNDDTPDVFVTASDVRWEDRVALQGELQKYVDTGISSTINLPKSTTLKDIEDIYFNSWKAGLKGVTVYVDGSRDGVLKETSEKDTENIVNLKKNDAIKRPNTIKAQYFPIKARGENFGVIIGYVDGNPYELFVVRPEKTYQQHEGVVTKIKKGKYRFESEYVCFENILDENINDEERSTSLFVSMLLRHNIDIKHIVKTTRKTSDNIVSFASAICRVLDKYVSNDNETIVGEKCPECGSDMIREGGCVHCTKCSFSKCGD